MNYDSAILNKRPQFRSWKSQLLACILLLPLLGFGQPDGEQQTTIRVNSSLVLVDVITQDTKTALPLKNLSKEDFRVFDNGTEMEIQSFDVGARYSARPIALWLVVICNEKDWDENGSGFMRGKTALLKPALEHLDKNDTLGVAHWCDDGTQAIDFGPAKDVDGALGSLEQLFSFLQRDPAGRPGVTALQRVLRLILENARHANPEPLPVLVFFYGDHSGMPREEADNLVKDLLSTSVAVFGINDGEMRASLYDPGIQRWQNYVAHFLAAMTGGQYFSVDPKKFAAALDDILVQVHFRYVLGFQPSVVDGKKHTLMVQLTDSAKAKYPETRLAFRPAYIPQNR